MIIDRHSARVKKMTNKKHRKGEGLVTFIANIDKFQKLLNAGYPQRSIYDKHEDTLGFSYSQFNRYVHKFLLKNPSNHQYQTKQPIKNELKKLVSNQTVSTTTGDKLNPNKSDVFTHNPSDGNTRKDLI